MANARSSKRDIDKAKRARAAEKRDRRQRPAGLAEEVADTDPVAQPKADNDALLEDLQRVHAQFAAHEMDFEDFEREKNVILAQLATD